MTETEEHDLLGWTCYYWAIVTLKLKLEIRVRYRMTSHIDQNSMAPSRRIGCTHLGVNLSIKGLIIPLALWQSLSNGNFSFQPFRALLDLNFKIQFQVQTISLKDMPARLPSSLRTRAFVIPSSILKTLQHCCPCSVSKSWSSGMHTISEWCRIISLWMPFLAGG